MNNQKVKIFSQLYDKIENGKKVCFVRYGLKNEYDKVILSPVYQVIGPFKNGLAIVMKDKKMGVVNQKGDMILPLKYDKIENQNHDMATFFVARKNVYELPDNGEVMVYFNGKYEKVNLQQTQVERELV